MLYHGITSKNHPIFSKGNEKDHRSTIIIRRGNQINGMNCHNIPHVRYLFFRRVRIYEKTILDPSSCSIVSYNIGNQRAHSWISSTVCRTIHEAPKAGHNKKQTVSVTSEYLELFYTLHKVLQFHKHFVDIIYVLLERLSSNLWTHKWPLTKTIDWWFCDYSGFLVLYIFIWVTTPEKKYHSRQCRGRRTFLGLDETVRHRFGGCIIFQRRRSIGLLLMVHSIINVFDYYFVPLTYILIWNLECVYHCSKPLG